MLNGVFATRFSAFFILLLVSSRLLWPGDSSFINDEPRLLEMALEQNSSGKLYSLGLMGSKGVQYGPVPIWYYRFLLVLTHDILLVSFINTLCITTLTLFGAVKLVREIRDLGPSLVSLVFLSPFLWFYSRNMWDNSLNIPVVLLGFSFYLAFHRKKDTLSLSVTFLMLVISLQIHLMAIPFAASILAHFFIFNLRWVREHKGKFFLLSAFSFAASLPYLKYLATTAETHSTAQTDLTSFLFPFLGADFFSAHNFSYFLGEKWQNSLTGSRLANTALFGITLFTLLSYPVLWAGMAGSVVYLWKNRNGQDSLWHASFISVFAICTHILLSVFKGLKTHPHYYNGVWVYSLLFMGMGFRFLSRKPILLYIKKAYISALFLSLLFIVCVIHRQRGSRSLHYGHTLEDLISAAKTLNEYSKETLVYPATFHTKYFARGVLVLQKFYPNDGPKKGVSGIVLRYRQPENKYDGSLFVEIGP